jgi:hypothetical protein
LQGGPVNAAEATNTAMGRGNLTMEAFLQTNTDSLQWLKIDGMWGEGHGLMVHYLLTLMWRTLVEMMDV